MRNSSFIILLIVVAFVMVALAAPRPGPGGFHRGGFGHHGNGGNGGAGNGGAGNGGAGNGGAGNGGAGNGGAGNGGVTNTTANGGNGGAGGATNTTGNGGTATNSPPPAKAAESSGQGATDNNVCKTSKKTLGNGTQNPNGQCSNTVQGEIPDTNHMVSTLIIDPPSGATLTANQAFNVTIANQGLNTGNFDIAASQYYIFPQKLDNNGNIFGHQHITIQQLQSTTSPPDPKTFAFFKGLNDPANGQGQLSVAVPTGLPAGQFRICSMTGTFSHQPVLMPVAQRGAQDDCIRVTSK